MKKLILFCLPFLLFVCSCENPLKINSTNLTNVTGNLLFTRSVLKLGDDYSIGYNNGNIQSDRITLRWQKCTDHKFISYKLFRANSLLKTYISADSTTFTDSLLIQDTEYNYRIVAFIQNGMSIQDSILLKTPEFLAPNQLSYTFLTNTSVKITWNNRAESATGYVIEKNIVGNEEVVTSETTTNFFVDADIVQGTHYRYRIKATNPFESTEFSPWQTFTFQYIMNAPHLNSLVQMQPSTDVKLNWTDNSTAEASFLIFRSVDDQSNFAQIGQTSDNITEYIDRTDKILDHIYYYYVQAYNTTETVNSNIMSIHVVALQFSLFDFETSNDGFSSNNPNGWEWGNSSLITAYSGTKIWGCPLDGGYPNSANYQLTSPSLMLPVNASLDFYHRFGMETDFDGGNVKVSIDNGLTWTLVAPEGGYTTTSVDALNGPGYTGSQSNWTLAHFNLAAYAGQQVLIRWTFASDSSVTSSGWFIDYVKIGNTTQMKSVKLEASCIN